MTAYLEIDDALYIIEQYGFYVRDVGLLQSALARPATIVASQETYPGSARKAAVLLESLRVITPSSTGTREPHGR